MNLIRKDDMNETYWVHLHLYIEDEDKSRKALLKAYSINPANPLVLNSLMSFYLKRKVFSKFFHVLSIANKIEHQNPFVLSSLFLINTIVGLSADVEDKEKKSSHLIEAMNLGQSFKHFDVRENQHMIELG